MNREQLLRTADRQRNQARVLVRQGRLERAHTLLSELIVLLQESLNADDDDHSSRSLVASALSDAYGMLGGVEWRRGNLREAGRAYGDGRDIEQSESYGILDSYNLTNSLVLRILLDPSQLSVMRVDLLEAAAVVRTQVRGQRRDQWWAWADYGLLNLLLSDDEQAESAYRHFEECGPGLSDYQSTARVLRSIADAIREVDGERAQVLADQAANLENMALHP